MVGYLHVLGQRPCRCVVGDILMLFMAWCLHVGGGSAVAAEEKEGGEGEILQMKGLGLH